MTLSGDITKSDANTLAFSPGSSNSITVTGNITTPGRVSTSGGTTTFSGNNSLGGVDIGSGGITLNSAGALGSSGSINWTRNGQHVLPTHNITKYPIDHTHQ